MGLSFALGWNSPAQINSMLENEFSLFVIWFQSMVWPSSVVLTKRLVHISDSNRQHFSSVSGSARSKAIRDTEPQLPDSLRCVKASQILGHCRMQAAFSGHLGLALIPRRASMRDCLTKT